VTFLLFGPDLETR